jgi:CheY-like chemotaxis protein
MATQESRRILICEDQKETAETLAALLRLHGYEVFICHDGPSAIAKVANWRPSAAIIDIGLPDITGYGVAQFIRDLPFGSSVLLIAVTGYGSAADIELARHSGFNWHFAKPAPPAFILEVLQDPRRKPIARQDGVPLNR